MTNRVGVVFHKNNRAALLQPPHFLSRHDGSKAELASLFSDYFAEAAVPAIFAEPINRLNSGR